MAGFLSKRQLSPKEKWGSIYTTARMNLIAVVVLTFINMVTGVFGIDSYFLFSAYIPYFLVWIGAILCGRMPDSYYEEMELSREDLWSPYVFIAFVAFALIITVAYLLFWIFSKKHVAWMVVALVFFSFDTVFMLIDTGFATTMLVDIIIHGLVIFYLIWGIVAYNKMKAIEKEPEPLQTEPVVVTVEEKNEEGETETKTVVNSPVIRRADWNKKGRILLEAEAQGHKICYRRVKHVNELIVDGFVYADAEMIMEPAHTLDAWIDGHTVQAGFDGVSKSYIRVDGEVVATKTRLF